jgi:hypothetical protein
MCHETLIAELVTNPSPGLPFAPGSEEKALVISDPLPETRKISRKADFLLRPVRPPYGGKVAPIAPPAAAGLRRSRPQRRKD